MFTSLLQSGHTCGDHCWHARELVCQCSCGGVNHGILLTKNGKQPQRTKKIDGNFYELVSVVALDPTKCQVKTSRSVSAEVNRIFDERFPGLSWLGYGEWRPEKTMPVVDQAISDSQAKWNEVKAVPEARRLIWARPFGTRYLIDGGNHKCVYTQHLVAADASL